MLVPLCAVTLSFKRKTHLVQEQKLCTQKRTRWEPWFLNGAEIEPTAQRFIQRSVFHLWLATLQLNVTLSRRIPMSHRFVGLNLQRYPALFLGYAIDVHSISFDQNSKHGDGSSSLTHKISSLEMRAAKKYMQFAAAVEVISKATKEAEERNDPWL